MTALPDSPPVDTGVVRAIRAEIQPRTGSWQFEFRPWHYWTAIVSTGVVFGGFLILCFALTWGAPR